MVDLWPNYPDILAPEDLMEILRVGRNTIYKYLANGTIESLRIAGKYRIPKPYLYRYLYGDMTFLANSNVTSRNESSQGHLMLSNA